MKSMVWVFFVASIAVVGRADAQVDVKAGGGLLFDPTRWGGHLSVEVPIGDTYPTYLASFVEFYRKDGVSEIPAGLGLTYKAPLSDRYGTVFFGVGGGILHARGFPLLIIDPIRGAIPSGETGSTTEAMIAVGGGVRFDVAGRMGVFVQGRWFRAFASGGFPNNFALHTGLKFSLGEGD